MVSLDLDCSQFLICSRYRTDSPNELDVKRTLEDLKRIGGGPCDNCWASTLQELAHCIESTILLLSIFIFAKLLQLCQMWFMMERIQNSYSLSERLLRVINRTNNVATSSSSIFGSNSIDTIEQLIAEGVDLNKPSGNLLPLQCACVVGDASFVEILLKNGADVNNLDGYQRAALHYAAEKSSLCVDLLLQYGADVDVKDANECTPLHWASYKNNYVCVRHLLENGADPNTSDLNADTPLSWAALKGHLESLEILLEYNCRVDTTNLSGSSPLIRLLYTIATGIGSTQDELCLDLLLKSLGQFDLRNVRTGLMPPNFETDVDLRTALLPYCTNVRSLQQLCRYAVRRTIGAGHLPSRTARLPLPNALRMYLVLKN